jgi:hypothetical protein
MKAADYEKMAEDCDRIAARTAALSDRVQLQAFAERLRREAEELRAPGRNGLLQDCPR